MVVGSSTLKTALLNTINMYTGIQAAINFIYFGSNKAISRHQIIFLIQVFTFDEESIKAAKMAKFGYSIQLFAYYYKMLHGLGYIVRCSPGNYSLTPSGIALVNTFLEHSGLK